MGVRNILFGRLSFHADQRAEHFIHRGNQPGRGLEGLLEILRLEGRGSLDPQARHLLWGRLEELRARGTTLLLTTHKERAELYKDQFTSKGLTVTIEPAEA